MTVTESFYFKCLRCAISGDKINDIPEGVDYKELFTVSSRHGLSVAVFYSLENVKDKLPKEFVNHISRVVFRETTLDVQSETDKDQVISLLKDNGIRCMPLKGYWLKKMYPKTEMRFASDCDILVDNKNLKTVKKLLLEKGYKSLHGTEHHDVYCNQYTKTIFEFHKKIFVGALEKYFGVGFERANLISGEKYLYNLSPNDFYIAVLAHYAYHFDFGAGVGFRAIVDLKVMKDYFKGELDFGYIDCELKKCGLEKFNHEFLKVVDYIFEEKEGGEYTQKLADYIYASSFLVNDDNITVGRLADMDNLKTAKKKAIIKKIFPSKENIFFTYPFIKKCKILLPLGYVIRCFRIVFKTPNSLKEFKEINSVKSDSFNTYMEIKKGLDIKEITKLQ